MSHTHLDLAKRLLKESKLGALATHESNGFPYVSAVEYCVDLDGRPYFFLSQLAVHTRNLLADSRVALVVADQEASWIVATERATFQGHVHQLSDKPDNLKKQYLEQHPHAEQYIDFDDFHFYEFEIINVRYIKGFGEMSRFKWS